jgi:hypothetical protein
MLACDRRIRGVLKKKKKKKGKKAVLRFNELVQGYEVGGELYLLVSGEL